MPDINYEEWIGVRDSVRRLDHKVFGNGKPSLEAYLTEYIDRRDAHKENNAKQDMQDLRGEIDDRHKENQAWQVRFSEKQEALMKLCYIGLGIVITLQAIGVTSSLLGHR